MRLWVTPLWTPRRGCSAQDWEDAVYPTASQTITTLPWCGAIADGASEAVFAGLWARMLVEAVGKGRLSLQSSWDSTLAALGAEWDKEIAAKGALPWFTEEKVHAGSFATLLALELRAAEASNQGQWHAVAVGDSCLFQVREDQLVAAFPLEKSSAFSNRPQLIRSRRPTEQGRETATGLWQVGDCFYLMTDALAAWFLSTYENYGSPWKSCSDFADAAPFANWVAARRDRGDLRDDDCTLLRLTLEPNDGCHDISLADSGSLQRSGADSAPGLPGCGTPEGHGRQ